MLLLVVMSVGIGIFVILRNNRRHKKLGGGHSNIQWFPLNSNNSSGPGRGPIHTDELDELVVESGIHDSDDEDDDE